jgi:Protein of unknown function (DUF429)
MTRIIAVDWSGNAAPGGQRRHIWAADISGDGVKLIHNKTREEIFNYLSQERALMERLIVGFDFAFSFPQSFFRTRSYSGVEELWKAVAEHGEHWLRSCEPPFWGRPGKRCPGTHREHGFRTTDRSIYVHGISPKSPFQIGGAGAVGTGSIRGMPFLLRLKNAGFSIWPFDAPKFPVIVEIYPRLLTGRVHKSQVEGRRNYLHRLELAWLPADIRKFAEDSEDAFDALISAVKMRDHAADFANLKQATDPHELLEGKIWEPTPI